ncbi:cell wall hydrolase [Paenibacillus aceris]|uniref:N-acetylmuramoyl-L-alanine amidase n=1 Tax=Paenibacillus aceris TaxID=869555 RepID=A0ABS4HQN0_9BACL|nr:cell wall hydrolase [Paenibacillus aceris]MBP1960917.1 N-acetylmuramoyl-L-alanine amidase [Paenibacillus aceris]NHW35412.1 cell wall hydrolase [Paenibacillus aceris]
MKKKLQALICVCSLGVMGMAAPVSAQSLVQGTQSDQVLDLQERLNALGYFNTGITGYYGNQTKNAVKKFQTSYGLSADGEADSLTLSKLKSAISPKQSVLDEMARIIHAEARGESFLGQVAVGAVVLNRVQSEKFPDSITEVIHQPGQFSSIDDGQFNLKPNESAYRAAKAALNGLDPTTGALYFYNPDIAQAAWSKKRLAKITIGNHVFTL